MQVSGQFDFIVVGAGSAGAVVAARLSEDPKLKVLLLDAGRSHRHPYVHVPALMMLSFPRPDMNWHYFGEPDVSRGGRVDMWPAGKTLGGGSAINGMMFVRGHQSDYDHWAQLGNRGWSHDDLLPYFRRLESSDTGENGQRGGRGPLSVEGPRSPHALVQPFLQACAQAGIPLSDDLNGANREGAGICQTSQSRGRRHSTAHAYLDPAASRANLTVVTGAAVERIIVENRRATGVVYRTPDGLRTVRAGRGVVVSAGAIASPKLLMLSGIGDGDELHRHGIETVHHLPGVGRNLQEHSGAPLRFEATVPSLTSDQGIVRSPIHALNYALNRRGPLATAIGHAQAFVRTAPDLAAPDIQIILSPSAHEIVNGKARRKRTPEMGLAVGLCHPRSRGEIRLRSNDPSAPPVIDHRLLDDEDDLNRIVEGIKIAGRILSAPAMAGKIARRLGPESEADIPEYVRQTAFLMFHPSGTCGMGQGPDAVVDEKLRVRGVDGLWVADASIIPAIPSGNINATCIMIGEKAADLIRQEAFETA